MPSPTALLQRQNPHSWYLTVAALLMSLTLVVDLLFHHYMAHRWLVWLLLVVSLSGAVAFFALGRRIPRWIGIVAVLLFLSAQAYFISLPDDPQSAIAALQQLPIVAFYLGWFMRPKLAIPLTSLSLLVFGSAMASNPLFHADGRIGAPVAVHALLSLLFCTVAGHALWRHAERADATDPLTGALIRAKFAERAAMKLRRSATPLCVVAVDFDAFKLINDVQGHAAGDRVLERTVATWRDELRATDAIGRLGGDEFAILLPGTDRTAALGVIDRLLAVSPHPWSWGMSEYRAGDDVAALLERADSELYSQKRCKQQEQRG